MANGTADTHATGRGRDVRSQTELSPRDATQCDGVTQSGNLVSVGALKERGQEDHRDGKGDAPNGEVRQRERMKRVHGVDVDYDRRQAEPGGLVKARGNSPPTRN
jgi:hypothetical protein